MTPFEIRLELVKLAKDMLSEEFQSKRSLVEQDWGNQVAAAMNKQAANPDTPLPETPKFPTYFTENDIVERASVLNEFISNGQFLPTRL